MYTKMNRWLQFTQVSFCLHSTCNLKQSIYNLKLMSMNKIFEFLFNLLTV